MWKKVNLCVHDIVITHLTRVDHKTPQSNKTNMCSVRRTQKLRATSATLRIDLWTTVTTLARQCLQHCVWILLMFTGRKQLIHTKTNLQYCQNKLVSMTWQSTCQKTTGGQLRKRGVKTRWELMGWAWVFATIKGKSQGRLRNLDASQNFGRCCSRYNRFISMHMNIYVSLKFEYIMCFWLIWFFTSFRTVLTNSWSGGSTGSMNGLVLITMLTLQLNRLSPYPIFNG